MNKGIFGQPSKQVLSSAVEGIDLSEWTRCLAYDGTPGTRLCAIPPDVTEVLVVVLAGGGSGAARLTAGNVSGGAGSGIAAAIVDLPAATQSVNYTVGAGGLAVVQSSTGATAGNAGGASSFGAFVSVPGGDGGSATGAAAVGSIPSVATAKKILSLFNGGGSGIASGSGLSATGGGSAASAWANGYASGAATTASGAAFASTGGGSCFAASGATTNAPGGGAGTTANSGQTGGGPASLMTDAVATFTGSPAVPAASFLDWLFTAAALADAVPAAAVSGWSTATDSAGRSGGSAAEVIAVGATGTNLSKAGGGGHFAGGGAARGTFSSNSGDHTVQAGAGGRFGGGGGSVVDFSGVSGVGHAVGGPGRVGGGGGAAVSTSGDATSGAGGNGLIAVFAKAAA